MKLSGRESYRRLLADLSAIASWRALRRRRCVPRLALAVAAKEGRESSGDRCCPDDCVARPARAVRQLPPHIAGPVFRDRLCGELPEMQWRAGNG
jgi:hypothetical protein